MGDKQGGYEVMVLAGDRRLDHVELSMGEALSIESAAQEHGLANLAAFPDYWGPEHRVPVARLAALLLELAHVEPSSSSPEAQSAVRKLKRVVRVAMRNGLPIDIVPD